MADRVARVVTEVFAPAVLVTALLVVIGWHAYGYTLAGAAWGLLAATFTSIIPFVLILRGVRSGALTDHHVGRRDQRRAPMLVALGSMAVGLVGLVAFGVERELLATLGAVVCGLIVSILVTRWWKISVHTDVAASAVVVLAEIMGPLALAALPTVPLVAWSRVQLRDHTAAQTIVGGLVGAAVTAVALGVLR